MHGNEGEVWVFIAELRTQTQGGKTVWCTETRAKHWVASNLNRRVEWVETGPNRWELDRDDAQGVVTRKEIKDGIALAAVQPVADA